MDFKENSFHEEKPENEGQFFSSGDKLREETERLRKENEEKIRKSKERNEDQKRENEEKKEEEVRQSREKYSKEFQKKPLNVEKIKPSEYTAKMRDEDLAYLDGWMQYEFGRFGWMMEELEIETKRRMASAINSNDLQEISRWHYEQIKLTHKYLDDKKKEIWGLKEKVHRAFFNREDPNEKREKEVERQFKMTMNDILKRLSSFDFSKFRDSKWQRKAKEYEEEILVLSEIGSYRGSVYEVI